MERAAAYIRVSTQEQKLHGLSLDAQEQKLKDYAKANKLDIVAWYRDEGVSGRKLISKRPELQRMLKDAQEKRFERIIFIKLDRFFRSVGEYHECMKMIEPVTWTATEEKYDLATANGRAFVNMKLTIAELEADQTAERIKLVNEYKAKSGIPVVPTRCLPFCFANEGRKMVKKNEAAIMDLIEHVELHHSIRGGMDYVNRKHGMDLLYRSVSAVLRNPLLCGEYRGNPNFCEGYISRERFLALQQIIARNQRTTPATVYIFQGLIRCPECGRRLNGTQHRTTVAGNLYAYPIYRCPAHRRDKSCGFATIVFESALERMVMERITPEMDGNYKSSGSQAEAQPRIDVDALRAELDRLNYSWQKGRIKSPEEYDRRYDEISARIDEAERQNAETGKDPNARAVKLLGDNWTAIYKDLSQESKKAFWAEIIDTIEIHWESGKYARKEISRISFR